MSARRQSVWQRLSQSDRTAIAATLVIAATLEAGARALSPTALALFARRCQLETWLRSLVYVELRARHGVAWVDQLPSRAQDRKARDAAHAYIASPDWEDPLAYLDTSQLFELIEKNWQLFEQSLFDFDSWRGPCQIVPKWLRGLYRLEYRKLLRHLSAMTRFI